MIVIEARKEKIEVEAAGIRRQFLIEEETMTKRNETLVVLDESVAEEKERLSGHSLEELWAESPLVPLYERILSNPIDALGPVDRAWLAEVKDSQREQVLSVYCELNGLDKSAEKILGLLAWLHVVWAARKLHQTTTGGGKPLISLEADTESLQPKSPVDSPTDSSGNSGE